MRHAHAACAHVDTIYPIWAWACERTWHGMADVRSVHNPPRPFAGVDKWASDEQRHQSASDSLGCFGHGAVLRCRGGMLVCTVYEKPICVWKGCKGKEGKGQEDGQGGGWAATLCCAVLCCCAVQWAVVRCGAVFHTSPPAPLPSPSPSCHAMPTLNSQHDKADANAERMQLSPLPLPGHVY